MNSNNQHNTWELLVGKIHNNLDKDEEKIFSEIENSGHTQQALQQVRKIRADCINSYLINEINKEENWKYISCKISPFAKVKNGIIRSGKYAAIAIIALSIGTFLPRIFEKKQPYQGNNRIEIEWGQMGKITLSDGTKVWLNAGTTFEYPTSFEPKKRVVKLSGEAQFKVVHDDNIPFEVVTKTGIIKVLGTTFNVSSYDEDPDVVITLIEGKVVVDDKKGKLISTLTPSEQISISKQTGEAKLKKIDTRFYSGWIDGKMLLENTKLADLVAILKRWYNVDIYLVGKDTGELQVSGTILKNKPLYPFLKILKQMYGIGYKLKPNLDKKDEIIIYKNDLPMKH